MSEFPPAIKTKFSEQVAIKYPIICAPMFMVSNEDMVVEASRNGGIGAFPAMNFRPIENYRKVLHNIRQRTSEPIAVNVIVQQSNKFRQQHLDIALEEKVPLIITSLGSPKEVIDKAHQAGSKVYCDVIHLEHAKKVEDLGADGLIAVSVGAGGHAGSISPFALIPDLVRHTNLPVIAAGNIVDGAGMLAAMALGASGIYMGTRFIASKESTATLDYKFAILKARCEDIMNTHKVDGYPGNFIATPYLKKIAGPTGVFETVLSKNNKMKRWLALARAARTLYLAPESKISYKTVFSAGQGVGLIDEILPIATIIHETIRQYQKLKAKLP